VARDLFRQVLEDRQSTPAGRLSALPLSVAAHAFVLVAVVAIPLFAPDVLPLVQASDIAWTPVVFPPSPPPIPAPPARPAAPAGAVARPPVPLEAPKGISLEPLVVPDTPPVAEAPELAGVVPGAGVPGGTGTVLPDVPPPPRPVAPVPAATLVTPPVKIRDASPVYPELPRLARQEGQAVIEAVIGVTGDVVETRVLRATPLFADAALAAVRQWKYRPTLLNGRPVPVVMTVTVTFRLK
jgi:periplasmic protein TonB